MTSGNRPIILAAALMHGLGVQLGAWRVRSGDASDYLSSAFYTEMARAAESGKLHALFLAEQMTNRDAGTNRPAGALDTATVLSHMAAVTTRLGLVGTGSTTYNEPYDIARRFATLDHLSGGRAGWNSVTTANPATAEMYGLDAHPSATERYARADEFIDVVVDLWDSWEDGALVGDKETPLFARPELVHELNHVGKYFKVRGPLPFPRSPQGRPVVFHAGFSEAGRDQAARVADVIFAAQHTTEAALEFRSDIRRRAAAYGRDPGQIKILPGMAAIIGGTEREAQEKKAAIDNALTLDQKLHNMSRFTGLSVEVLVEYMDRPFPVDLLVPDEQFKGTIGWRRSIVGLAVKENLTVRELMSRAPNPHQHVIGTAEQVADAMEERLAGGAADGFVMMVDVLPEGVHDIVEMLVPELVKRGLLHSDYEGETLRENLGIDLPKARA